MNMLWRSLVLGVLVTLSGCVLRSNTFYEPSGPEGNDCTGAPYVGVCYAVSTIRLARGNLTFNIDGRDVAYYPDKFTDRVIIDIWVPAGEVLQFPINDIEFSSPDPGAKVTLTCVSDVGKMLCNETELKGDLYPGGRGTGYVLFETFDGPKPDIFYIDLPSMQAGGKSYPPIKIQFKKTRHWFFPILFPAT